MTMIARANATPEHLKKVSMTHPRMPYTILLRNPVVSICLTISYMEVAHQVGSPFSIAGVSTALLSPNGSSSSSSTLSSSSSSIGACAGLGGGVGRAETLSLPILRPARLPETSCKRSAFSFPFEVATGARQFTSQQVSQKSSLLLYM